MTGSGSLCYGIFSSDKAAKAALNKVKSKYQNIGYRSQKLFNLQIYDISKT